MEKMMQGTPSHPSKEPLMIPAEKDDKSADQSMGRLDILARSAVLRQLSRIEAGRLRIIEHDGNEYNFGSGNTSELRATMQIHSPAIWRQIAAGGQLAAGETYMDNLWTTDDLVALTRLFIRNDHVLNGMQNGPARLIAPARKLLHFLNRNTESGSRRNISAHYDLGNDFFALWLDETMSYSAAIYPHPDATLLEASRNKLEHTCRKLRLQPGEHLLEIGTGWGALAIHAARNFGCRVTTTTISRRQYELACQRVEQAGLSDRITVLLEDYRNLTGQYDKLVSIEMIEAIGRRYYDTYFEKCCSLLKPDGLMLIQAITIPDNVFTEGRQEVDFIKKHIFPGSEIPAVSAMAASIRRVTDFTFYNLEDLTLDYARTLSAWRASFHDRLDEVRALRLDDRFIRMWDFYLATCEGGFAERYLQDVQILWARPRYRGEHLFAPRGESPAREFTA